MKIFPHLILIFILIESSKCIKSNQICEIPEQFCKRNNNKLNEACFKYECNGMHTHRCTYNHCTLDQHTCKKFISMNSFMINMQRVQFYQKEVNHLRNFLSAIKSCKPAKLTLNINEACVNSQNCILKEAFVMRNPKQLAIRRAFCKCAGEHSFQCKPDVCTTTKLACDHLKSSNVRPSKKCSIQEI